MTGGGPALTLPAMDPVLGAFVGYLVVVVAIGVWASRFSSGGVGEFFLAGRSLNRWVVALSAVVSGRSSWLILGLSGLAWAQGVSALWAAVGYIVVEFVLFWTYAGRLRRFSGAHDCLTLPDVYAARFDDRRGVLRLLIVAVLLVFLPTYVGAQFVAGGKTFASAFGVGETNGVLITAVIVLAYTVTGGFLAVSLTDVLQALFMVVALVVLPVVAITDKGGWGAVTAELSRLDATLLDPMALSLGALVGLLGIGLGSPGNPHILVRYMSIDDPGQLRASALLGTAWNVIMAAGAVLIGLAGRAWFPVATLLPGGDREALSVVLSEQHLPPVVHGIVLASIFAAIMSTTDSQLLVAASSVVRDVYQQFLRKGRGAAGGVADEAADSARMVRLSRVVVLVLVLVAIGLGLAGGELVFWFVLLAWGGLGAALGPTSILALYWKRTTHAGVVAGMAVGAVTVFVWDAYDGFGLYELVPAFVLGALATVLVSLVTRPPADVDAMFDTMRTPEPRSRP